tara:strand:+ start:107 stop:499 length:393 start_codon:yes stop_codon:yes gene_type:complete
MFRYFFAGGGRIKKTQKVETSQSKQTKQSKVVLPPLKKGELIKHGYKDIKTLTIKKRHKALDAALTEFPAQTVLRKLNILKTLQKRNIKIVNILTSDMKYIRKKYDNQFKSSWKSSQLFTKRKKTRKKKN